MKRFYLKTNEDTENKKVDDFLSELHDLYKKHNLCIEHEDNHGAFIIEKYDNEKDFEWLNNAFIGKTVDDT